MSFNLSFNISEGDNCQSVTLCDTTCLVNHYNKYTCCDGYGIEGNISREDIAYTRFHWKFPDGSTFYNVDMNWTPGTRSKAIFKVDSGTTGVIVVGISNIVLGQVIFLPGVLFYDTVVALIQSINSIAETSGWQAYLLEGTQDTIILEAVEFGIKNNDLPLTVSVSGDIVVTMIQDPTTGANGNENCVCFGINDIYELSNECSTSGDFPDGVYEVTYILYDSNDKELGRVTNHFLLTCLLKCIIRKLILLPAEDKCSCSDGFQSRLIELRLMLEKAETLMDDCNYDCANETMTFAHVMAEGICLDC